MNRLFKMTLFNVVPNE